MLTRRAKQQPGVRLGIFSMQLAQLTEIDLLILDDPGILPQTAIWQISARTPFVRMEVAACDSGSASDLACYRSESMLRQHLVDKYARMESMADVLQHQIHRLADSICSKPLAQPFEIDLLFLDVLGMHASTPGRTRLPECRELLSVIQQTAMIGLSSVDACISSTSLHAIMRGADSYQRKETICNQCNQRPTPDESWSTRDSSYSNISSTSLHTPLFVALILTNSLILSTKGNNNDAYATNV